MNALYFLMNGNHQLNILLRFYVHKYDNLVLCWTNIVSISLPFLATTLNLCPPSWLSLDLPSRRGLSTSIPISPIEPG